MRLPIRYAAAGSLKFASDGIVRQMGQLQD